MKINKYIIIGAFTVLTVCLGFYIHKSGRYEDTIRPTVKKIVMPVYNFLRNVEDVEIEHLIITISENDYNAIKRIRQQAFDDEYYVRDKDKYFPATIQWHDSIYKVKLRLKGDMLDHLDSEKWSYRIFVNGNRKILDMTSFSIQHPKTRNFIWEWVYHEMMKKEGIIALDYKFIKVTINDSNYGIFAMEEGFNDHILVKNKRKSGTILKFDEEKYWQQLYKKNTNEPLNNNKFFIESKIISTAKNDTSFDIVNQTKTLIMILDSFKNGKINSSEIFDINIVCNYLAISEILGARHGLNWINQRMYFNAISKKIEPIAFDGEPYIDNSKMVINIKKNKTFEDPFWKQILLDTLFFNLYLEKLSYYSKKIHFFLNNMEQLMEKNKTILDIEFPNLNSDYEEMKNLLFLRNKEANLEI